MSRIHAGWKEARRKAEASLSRLTNEEDAKLTAAANSDPDCPPMTDAQLRRLRPASEIRPHLVEAARKMRGRPKLEEPKVQVTLRLDADVVRAFRAKGSGWQSRMNEALAKAAKTTKPRKRA